MTPVFIHLKKKFPELNAISNEIGVNVDLNTVFSSFGADFYGQLMGFHPHLNMEYSILCQKIRHDLASPNEKDKQRLVQELNDALLLAELLEYLNFHYLIVPREVQRLRNHKKLYLELLTDITGISFKHKTCVLGVDVGLSLSQLVREDTGASNWYRILLSRSKRVLNALATAELGTQGFINFVGHVDVVMNPFLAYLGWCFFVPRFATNVVLLLKHTIPGFWMRNDERLIDWRKRLVAQLQRRWFELGNDGVWLVVGLLNCFLLVGPLAPVGVYLSLAAFMFDVINVAVRAYIELGRLNEIKKDYLEIYRTATDEKSKQDAHEYLLYIEQRIQFEQLRSGLAISGAVAVVLATSLAVPLLAFAGPMLPVVAAVLLILIWLAMFKLTSQLEIYRPKDAIEKPEPSALSKLSMFARRESPQQENTAQLEVDLPGEFELTTFSARMV